MCDSNSQWTTTKKIKPQNHAVHVTVIVHFSSLFSPFCKKLIVICLQHFKRFVRMFCHLMMMMLKQEKRVENCRYIQILSVIDVRHQLSAHFQHCMNNFYIFSFFFSTHIQRLIVSHFVDRTRDRTKEKKKLELFLFSIHRFALLNRRKYFKWLLLANSDNIWNWKDQQVVSKEFNERTSFIVDAESVFFK